jgi:hypothetical protein
VRRPACFFSCVLFLIAMRHGACKSSFSASWPGWCYRPLEPSDICLTSLFLRHKRLFPGLDYRSPLLFSTSLLDRDSSHCIVVRKFQASRFLRPTKSWVGGFHSEKDSLET